MELTINGNPIKTKTRERISILNLARENGFFIPTLCHHPALEPFGSCRLCTVEIEQKGRIKLDTACTHPAEEGLAVDTNSPRVKRVRKMVLSFFLARCPDVQLLKDLACKLEISPATLPFQISRDEKCILCGRCVRVCREVIGKRAISFAFRGEARRPSAPYGSQAEDCIGCTACEFVCPTGAVLIHKEKDSISIFPWDTDISLLTCSGCGSSVITQKAVDYLINNIKFKFPQTSIMCEKCRRKQTAQRVENLPELTVRGFMK